MLVSGDGGLGLARINDINRSSNTEWCCVDTDCHRRRPVSGHLVVFVVETFQLKFKVGPE